MPMKKHKLISNPLYGPLNRQLGGQLIEQLGWQLRGQILLNIHVGTLAHPVETGIPSVLP